MLPYFNNFNLQQIKLVSAIISSNLRSQVLAINHKEFKRDEKNSFIRKFPKYFGSFVHTIHFSKAKGF